MKRTIGVKFTSFGWEICLLAWGGTSTCRNDPLRFGWVREFVPKIKLYFCQIVLIFVVLQLSPCEGPELCDTWTSDLNVPFFMSVSFFVLETWKKKIKFTVDWQWPCATVDHPRVVVYSAKVILESMTHAAALSVNNITPSILWPEMFLFELFFFCPFLFLNSTSQSFDESSISNLEERWSFTPPA